MAKQNFVEKALAKLGEFEYKHTYLVLILILALTSISFYGITKIEFQSDLDEMNPQDLPVVELNNRIDSEFSNFEPVLIVIEIDPDTNPANPITDIRDPRIIDFLKRIQNNLKTDASIESVQSIALIFPQTPQTLEQSKQILSNIPNSDRFFTNDYSLTTVFVESDVGADNEKIQDLNQRIRQAIQEAAPPGGIKTTITGNPPLGARIFNFLIDDALNTLLIATAIIFIFLLIVLRSLRKSVVVILPLLIGLFWTLGLMGFFNIPITIGTAGISAMLLGLGVEYSIFLMSRFEEERKSKDLKNSIIESLSTTGASTVSSGLTTIIGFGALTLSLFPVLSDLGFSLALGIALILIATMTANPVFTIIEEKIWPRHETKKQNKTPFYEKIFEKYGKFLSNHPILILIVFLGITVIMFNALTTIENQDINFQNVLPEDLEELKAFEKIQNQNGETISANIFVELSPTLTNSNEPEDIRHPDIIKYIDRLTQKAEQILDVQSVNSISNLEKQTLGKIPNSLQEQKQAIQNLPTSNLITSDYSGTIIRITLNEDASDKRPEVVRQIKEIIQTTPKPAGLAVYASGGIVVQTELNQIIGPDSSRTALYAFGAIIVLLYILSRSIKYTILPLLTVIFGVIWTLGLVGLTETPFNNITSSVISMTIGIGIDFGLQLSNRFRQELETHEKKQAMTNALKGVLYPMIITVIAALAGFRAMQLGQLNLMGDLGTTMGFGITASMIVAVTIVASIMVLLERKKI